MRLKILSANKTSKDLKKQIAERRKHVKKEGNMLRTKLVVILLMLGIVGVLVSAGTYAWFFDDEVSTGNKFQTGTIDIEVEDVTSAAGGDPKIVAEENGHNLLKPSQVGYLTKRVKNVGNNPARIFKMIPFYWTQINGGADKSVESETTETEPNGGIKLLWNHMDFDLIVNNRELIPYSSTDPAINTPLLTVQGRWMYLGTLKPDEEMTVRQSFHLQADADGDTNWAQDDWIMHDENFKALQLTGAATPTPEHPLP